ncbi:hypothetical protein [Marinobacter nauticus]|uniref:hypothetical protein n=1 Tax=Marinobacter nauticus TaxID=2743 RepID=UPI000EB17E7C|nr:hypothetical protein [Marinobacter nauticus]RKR79620.1 chromosome segregation ATPase [Marinobacter nauticus]
MALKDSIINLVLKGKDLMTPATKTAADSVGKLQERSDELTTALEKLTKTERNIEQFKKLSEQSDRLKDNWQEAEYELQQLKETFEATEKPTKAMARELEKAEKSAEGAQVAWRRNRDSLDRLTPQLKAAGVNMDNLDQAQDDVQQSAMRLRSDLTGVNVQLDRQEQAAKEAAEGTEELGDEAERSSGLISKLGAGIKTVAAGAAALVASIGASAATLTVFSRSQASLADEITNTSNAIGVNREALQVWQVAGERVGLTGEKVTDILRSVTERLGEFAANGGGEAAQVMERLNLQIEDFEGLAPDEQMLKFAEAIESLPKAEQVALLEKLGSDASQLQPLLEDNAAGLRAIAAEAAQSGAIYSEEELDKLLRANDIYNSITIKIQGLTRRIGAELAPAVADATDKVVKLFDQNETGEKLIDMFRRITTWGADMATKLVENADSISAGFGKLWDTIQAGANGAVAIFRGLQTIVAAWSTLVAGSFATVLSIAEGLAVAMNKAGLVSDETLNNIRSKAEAARQSVMDLGQQTAEYGRQAVEAGKGVVDAFDGAADAGTKLQEKTEKGIGTLTTLAENVETAVRKAGDETTKARQKAKDLAEAYETLGIESQAALNKAAETAKQDFETILASGKATKRELSEAFQAYAQAIIDSGDKAKIRALEVEAAQLGLRDALREVRAQAEESGDAASSSAEDIAIKAGKAADETKRLADETRKAKQEAEAAREKFRETLGASFSKAISTAREQVTALSVAARNLFEMKIGGNAFVKQSEDAAASLERARQRTDELASARRRLMSSSLAAWFADTALHAAETEERFWAQAVAMENLQEKIESGSFSLSQLNGLSETAATRFDVLDKQRLSGLQSAIDSAKQKLQSLTDTADNTLNSLRQRLADIRGDTEEAQRIQYESERKRLQEQLEQARQAGADAAAADYQQSLDTLEKIYQIEQKNRREEQNAREKEAADRARDQQLAEIERQRAGRDLNKPTPAASPPSRTIVLQGPSGNRASVSVAEAEESNLLDVLEDLGYRSNA